MKLLERQDEELGTVRLCRSCCEEWPVDGEFWYFDRTGRVMGYCKACWSERPRTAYTKQVRHLAPEGYRMARSHEMTRPGHSVP